jgi:hypothetical protein
MEERRQVFRRAPIKVEVRDRTFEARPLPWLSRNDLGNEIMRQYADTLNSSLRSYVQEVKQENGETTEVPGIGIALNDRLSDPMAVLKMAYTDQFSDNEEFFQLLDLDEGTEMIKASLEVNRLSDLIPLVDPNFLAPENSGGESSSGTESPTDGTQKMPSSPDSSSLESDTTTSVN